MYLPKNEDIKPHRSFIYVLCYDRHSGHRLSSRFIRAGIKLSRIRLERVSEIGRYRCPRNSPIVRLIWSFEGSPQQQRRERVSVVSPS